MFDEALLRELAVLQAQGPVLSLYLEREPGRSSDEVKLALRELLEQVEDEADKEDIEAVRRYVALEHDRSGRGLVIFSRQAEDLWYALSLAVPVRSGVTVAQKPYISPLVELDSIYGRYAVAIVDRQGGRFYLFQMGELTAQEGYLGQEVRGARKGSGSSMVGMRGGGPGGGRREEAIVQRNLKETAEALEAFCRRHKPRQLLLAGTEHTVAQFVELLPPALRSILAGTFNADMSSGEVEVRQASLDALARLQARRKEELVDAVFTAAAKGANGVIRLGETLSAAHEGRIQVLLIELDFHQPGYRCTGCGYLTTQRLERCPFCGSPFAEIPDAAEAVVTQVVEKGGTVEVVDNGAMGEAHIGALLRY